MSHTSSYSIKLNNQQRATAHTDVDSKQFHMERGTKQGATLSFNSLLQYIMKPLPEKWNRGNHGVTLVDRDRYANFFYPVVRRRHPSHQRLTQTHDHRA